MDEKTKVLVCLGAATAANCVPCFEHYFGKAESSGLSAEEIQEAVELASQVKKGAHLALTNGISKLLGQRRQHDLPRSSQSRTRCCG